MIDQGVNLILQRTDLSESRDFNRDIFYGNDLTASKLIEIAKSYPMMAAHRTIVVRDVNKMPPIDLEALAKYVQNPSPTTYLILTQRGKLSTKKALAPLRQKTVLVECRPLYDNQIVPWIQTYVGQLDLKIAQDAAQFLAMEIGNSVQVLRSELEKIQIFMGKSDSISLEHAQQVVGFSKEYSVFSLQDAIGEKKLSTALRIAENLKQSVSNSAIIYSLVRYFGHLYLAQALHRKQDLTTLSQKTGVHRFFAEKLQRAARNYPAPALFNSLEVLQHADYLIKTRNISRNLLLQLTIIAIVKNISSQFLPFPKETDGVQL